MRTTKSAAGILAIVTLSISLPAAAQLLPEVTEKAKKAPAPRPSQIVIVTNPAAQVYLDDVFKGQASPQGRLVIENPKVGDHTLRISLSGKSDYEKQVKVTGGQVTRVEATLVDAGTRTGSTEVNRIDGLKYSWIPPGTFQMGCSQGDTECYGSENPSHPVTLTRGFWIGQTDVTVGAYKKYVAATGASMPPYQKTDEHPAVNVNYDDGVSYCGWAGGRLPTEAEWEYAARGGSTEGRYGPLDTTAWYDQNSGNEWHAVAQKRPNGFGLFDMLGNVWQWVDSWWDADYYKTSPSVDPPGLASAQNRVLRGGSYFNTANFSRVSERNYSDPTKRNITFGLRCVADTTPSRATQVATHLTTTPTKQPLDEAIPTDKTSTRSDVNRVDGLRYVWIPPGTFEMGCASSDTQCYASESPQHQVTLTKGFWMGKTDVTVAAYKKFAAAAGIELPALQKDDNYPVVNLNWNDATAYCGWAGGRLPTDAEWEYAARGGSTDIRYGPLDSIGWYDQNSGNEWHPVGQKLPNGFGLYDMIGNVWQWVDSWWDTDYYKSSPSTDPPGLASGQYRVMRGGSWFNAALYSRASMRNYGDPTIPNTTFGARCVTDVAPSRAKSGGTHLTTTTPTTTTAVTNPPEKTSTAMTTRVNPKDGLTYVWIPSGTFRMGCSETDTQCYNSERPAHQVTLSKGFWIGQTAVTVAAYKKFIDSSGAQMPGYQRGDQYPIVNVSWNDAVAYCRWAGGRLPTEAEWEYAARAGNSDIRYAPLDSIGWYDLNSDKQWHEVAQKFPNAFGLYDMIGNVWQWVDAWWDMDYYKSSPLVDPPGLAAGQYRVMRGGSWFNGAQFSRASMRNYGDPVTPNTTFGIRCAADAIGQ
jgi:formylglycine-generating enzyme required for sulfatase activity